MNLKTTNKCLKCKRFITKNCIGIEVAEGMDISFCKLFLDEDSTKQMVGQGFQEDTEPPKRKRKQKGA